MVQRRDPMTDFLSDMDVGEEIPQNWSPEVEIGATGLKRAAGIIDEEFLPALRTGRKSIEVFREMHYNDPIIAALVFAITQLIRNVDFKVVPVDESKDAKAAAEFLESCKDDMSHSWSDFIAEVCTMIPYGWSWHEIVYKRRLGPWEKDPAKRSKFTDGKIGWRKMPIRSQETLLRWVFDESGGVKAMVQIAPPNYQTTVLPIEKCLLFRTDSTKNNPEGKSILRGAYRPWYIKKRLEEFEAIGVERDLAGMPVARVPASFLGPNATPEQKKMVGAFRKMVRGVRRDENEGLILPSQFDPDTKQQLFDFELMSAGGSRQFDTSGMIQRYEQRMLMTVLADFILVGHQGVGSYSMHTDKTGMFRNAINAIAESVADTLNRYAVPRLFEVNGWRPDELPKFEPVNVDPPDLSQLASFISATAAAGMEWFPDPELEKFVRDIARLPEMTEDAQEFKSEMVRIQQQMQATEQQMQFVGMQQKAEMTEQGMTPEQAEMQAQQPTPEQQEQQVADMPPEQQGGDDRQAIVDRLTQMAGGNVQPNEQQSDGGIIAEIEALLARKGDK